MTRYLMSGWYPAGAAQPDDDTPARITRDVDAVHRDLQEQGAWVFGAGLYPSDTATVVTAGPGRAAITDGPFAETKEMLGGFSIIEVDDLDAALAWAERLSEATTCPIEVRPFQADT